MALFFWLYVVPDALHYGDIEPYLDCVYATNDYESLVWIERYKKAGEFTLVMNATPELFNLLSTRGQFIITRVDTDRAMLVERVILTTSASNGCKILVTGKSAEGLTKRRIVQQIKTIDEQQGNDHDTARPVTEIIEYYMRENIASHWYYASDAEHSHGENNPLYKRYCNLIHHGDDDIRITSALITYPYGMNLGTFIEDMCTACGFGFKMSFDGEKFLYSCYMGVDRTVNQTENDPVVFSEEYENLGDTEYTMSSESYITQAVAGGSGTGSQRAEGSAYRDFRRYDGVGLNIREIFVNASGTKDSMLSAAARDAMNSTYKVNSFECETLSGGQFHFRKDYNIGDIVTVRNAYGITGSAVIEEVVESIDSAGYRVIPKFS